MESLNLATGKEVRLGGSPGGLGSGVGSLSLGADDSFAVSADGSRVAYVVDSPYINASTTTLGITSDVFAIGVVRSSGAAWHLLPQPVNASDASPSFSPNGTQVVLTRSSLTNGVASASSLMVQPLSGGQARPLRVTGKRPVWSPNGHWIAYQQVLYGPQGLLHSGLAIVRPSGQNSHALWNPNTLETARLFLVT